MNFACILLLIFLVVTFVQSGYDKISDWEGNVAWLKNHFSKTAIGPHVAPALAVILALELASGILCSAGAVQLVVNGERYVGYYGAICSCVTLILLLLGQRLAKDYDGARTIAIYFVPAVMAVFWLS